MEAELTEIQQALFGWFERSAAGLPAGRFRFCLNGSLTPVAGHQALFATCFAMKAAWQAGLWDSWTVERRSACIDFVRSFQTEAGWFVDPWLRQAARPGLLDVARYAFNACTGRPQGSPIVGRNRLNVRAETRQAVSTLLMVGSTPTRPLPMECPNPDDARRYLDRLDWTQPWDAGSHLSHLLFMWTVNRAQFGLVERYDELVDVVMDFLSGIRDTSTQCWYLGDPTAAMKINGAMKVFSGLQWLDRPYPDCSRLMDLALSLPFLNDGCGFFNRLFVVSECRRACPKGYRGRDITSLAEQALRAILTFRKPDGGFSFYTEHAQTGYYGAPVSDGLEVSDLHGAAMVVWATALCLDMVGARSAEAAAWSPHKA